MNTRQVGSEGLRSVRVTLARGLSRLAPGWAASRGGASSLLFILLCHSDPFVSRSPRGYVETFCVYFVALPTGDVGGCRTQVPTDHMVWGHGALGWKGGVEKVGGSRPCRAWGEAIFHNIFPNVFRIAVLVPTTPLRPLSSLILERIVHVFSLSDSIDLNRGTEGYLATHLASHF